MEEENQAKNKQLRRTKKNFEGDLINCGCGKNYMSYPALNQHIKAKHEGVPPEGTAIKPSKKPAVTNPVKQPEPKPKEEKPIACGCGRTYQSFASLKTHIKMNHDGVAPEGTDQKPQKTLKKKKKTNETTANLLEERKLNGESSLSEVLEDPHEFIRYVKEQTLPIDNPKTCEEAFANYLGDLPKQVNEAGLKLFTRYISMLYDCLNKRGWEMDKLEKDGVYCKVNTSENVPSMANFYLTTYIPHKSEEYEKEAELFYQHLCEWLFHKGLTSSKLVRATYS